MAQKTPVFIKPKYDRQNYKYNRNMWAIVCKISRWRMVSLKKKKSLKGTIKGKINEFDIMQKIAVSETIAKVKGKCS